MRSPSGVGIQATTEPLTGSCTRRAAWPSAPETVIAVWAKGGAWPEKPWAGPGGAPPGWPEAAAE